MSASTDDAVPTEDGDEGEQAAQVANAEDFGGEDEVEA